MPRLKEPDGQAERVAAKAAAMEDHYRATWRTAHPGARTDWDLIGEPARVEWRAAVDVKR